jgi:hypothetical protein
VKLKLRGALFRCGRCRKSYSNPFGHTCVAPVGRRPGKTKLMPSASATCPKCRKPYGNPFTHTCTVRTDFKRRTTKAKKDAAAAKRKARPQHPRPSACRDGDCKRAACQAYREGREDGFAEGYDEGFAEGIAACPRERK